MATSVVPRKPKAALCDPVKRTVCLKMAASPYPLHLSLLNIDQQALVLRVLFDATDDGAFRFESAETVLIRCVTIVEKHSAADKEEKHLALRGWMQFTTAKNAKEFIKHWSKVIQTRLATGEVPFLVSVEHSVRSLDDGNSVQRLMLGKTFTESSGVGWSNVYRALSEGKFSLPPGDVRPEDQMRMPRQLLADVFSSLPKFPVHASSVAAYGQVAIKVVQQTSDFRIAAKAGPAGNQQYTGPSGAFQATKAPLQVANTAPLPHKAVTAAQVPSSKAQAAPNAVSTARPAVSTPHLQLPKASHLNTAAPAFVPRTLRAAPLTTDAKPAASAAQPTVANTKLAAPTPSPGKLKAFKEFIPQRLLTAVQPAPKVDQHTQAAHTPATQPATQPAALAPSFARAEVQVAEQQPHHHPVANMQPAAESSQSPDAVQQPTAVAAQQGAPSDQSHQSTVQSDQLEVQPDQSRMLSHQAAVQSDQLVVQSNQSAAWSDQHDINARPAAAQDQWADTGPSEMQSAAPSVSFASLGVEVPALEDATEEEIEKVVLSEEALTWYCVVDGFYLDSPLFPLPVVGHSAFAKLPVRAEEVESLVHSGSISTYRPPEIWTYQQKAELDLWESFDVEAQQ